jgi:hypothetical protein
MEKIFATRNYRLAWFEASPQITYGEALHALDSLHSDTARAIIAVSTPSQLASKSVGAFGFPIAFCPYPSPSIPTR